MSKLKELKDRIYELLSPEDFQNGFTYVDGAYVPCNSIREAQILKALDGVVNPDHQHLGFSMDTDGLIFWTEEHATELTIHGGCEWTLGKPLDEQPEEVINFLHVILIG